MTSPPETLKSDGFSSTLRTLTFPSTTKADHLHQKSSSILEVWKTIMEYPQTILGKKIKLPFLPRLNGF